MLAGYLAADFSETGKIGTYGGQQFPGVTLFMDGLYAGIKYHNEKNGTTVELLGWNAADQTGTFVGGDNPWGDPAKGESLAQTFLDQGADIVQPVSGATGNGTIKAMMAAGKYAFGVDSDQALSLPEYAPAIITSSQKVIDVAVLDLIKKNAGGDPGGEDYVGTLANNGVALLAVPRLRQQDLAGTDDRARSAQGGHRVRYRQGRRLPQVVTTHPLVELALRPQPAPQAEGAPYPGGPTVHAARTQGHHEAVPGRPGQ